jgi:hypothetical protein
VPPAASSNVVGLPNTLSLAHHHASSPITAHLEDLAHDTLSGLRQPMALPGAETSKRRYKRLSCMVPHGQLHGATESFVRGSNRQDGEHVSTRHHSSGRRLQHTSVYVHECFFAPFLPP